MKQRHVFFALAAAALLYWRCLSANAPPPVPVAPATDAVYTATRAITSLAVEANGAPWAGTPGGVLRRDASGHWRKFTRLDGLPAHEVSKIEINDAGEVEVFLPRARAVWREQKWRVEETNTPPPNAPTPVRALFAGHEIEASAAGLRMKDGEKWRALEMPPSSGTHISALLARDGVLWAALFGDGLWSFDGERWARVEISLPGNAREITALAEHQGVLWLGTRRDGVWNYDGKIWDNHLEPGEPFDHNAQFLQMFRGELWMSSLEDGLAIKTARGWKHVAPPTISSNAPRHLVEFRGALYVRHGTGTVDRFDGEHWQRDVFPNLPRKKVFALAADENKLYAAQWGGWSEWDGKNWTHHLKEAELQGLPLMLLHPDGARLWIGTQSRGLAEYSAKTGKLIWHDERDGLKDDWITAFAIADKTPFVGTFVGGLARRENDKWTSFKALDGKNVTALEADGEGGLFVATRHGVWTLRAGVLRPLENSFVAPEAQALLKVLGGLWIGTRTGLFFVRDAP